MTRESDYLGGIKRAAEQTVEAQHWEYLTTPLTSTSWDGDAHSDTAKTLIDLSATFTGVPANIHAVLVAVEVRDSGTNFDCRLILSPNNTAGSGIEFNCIRTTDGWNKAGSSVIPCNSDGDIYYQIDASGALTLDAVIRVWGWAI